MPRFDSLLTSDGVPATSADVAAAEAAAIAAAAIQSAADAAAAQAAATAYTDAFDAPARASLTGPQTIGAGGNAQIVFDDEIFDAGANFDPGTGLYTTPVAGVYRISGQIKTTGAADDFRVAAFVGGVPVGTDFLSVAAVGGAETIGRIDTTINVGAGTTLGLWIEDLAAGGFDVTANSFVVFNKVSA